MSLKVYNTLTRKKEPFIPIQKGKVSMYSCGPTVYWYQHIGNLRSYIFSDILKRVLLFNGYKVKHIINITDVGHLTSDADSGEDKMEKAASKEGKTAKEIAEYYFNVFEKDLNKLNIIIPEKWTKATENIKEQIELIKILERKGFTYKTPDGIYFNTSKFKDYSKFAKLKVEGLQAGKRISMGDKRNPTDFALWKFSPKDPNEKRQQEWKSPWGTGFPGWHIECSAMSIKYLGEHFDIHTGGIDHISVHHTNEIAQSEAATGKKFVNYWLHGNFLTLKGEKVSKSKGGLFTLTELEEKGFPPLSYRYFCLTTHYRAELDFSIENLESSQNAYKRLKNICENIKEEKNEKENKKYLEEFKDAIDDDLNIPKALQVLWNLVRDEKVQGKYKTISKIDEVFGLKLLEKEKIKVPKEIRDLVEQREKARKNKEFKLSDQLREKIHNLGFTISDTKDGAVIKKLD
ncbi:MAG: cysteine--tRNA ligase [Nanoarchaeota archaeon]